MATVTLQNVNKSFGKVEVVQDLNLEIADGEFLVLLGPSGCGKSTTLRMVAGLEDVSSGEIAIDGKVVNDIDPRDRNIAMVFQNYALYPHMTVYQNLAFGLRMQGMKKREIVGRANEVAELLQLSNLLKRFPAATVRVEIRAATEPKPNRAATEPRPNRAATGSKGRSTSLKSCDDIS